ncbi:hypothetical protein PENVUL_c028G07042 [Penicillium vulpinum]|uniref:Beta-lactamase-related domain-containing protein n=1 Tax=Penicillium vulpinum TaxID=29845 RepID=A0A1V6RT04_9EURO|nr:hypothetical protein PENVUL_c028G07042 [Penicillium vulpinum]
MEAFTKNLHASTDLSSPNAVSAGIVATAVGRGGKKLYFEAAGDGTGDSLWWLASQGKLFCTVAVLQAVERGLIGLHDDVSDIVPELGHLPIVDGENPDGTSGLTYNLFNPTLQKWEKEQGSDLPLLNKNFKSFETMPLIFEHGTDWAYGSGLVCIFNYVNLGVSQVTISDSGTSFSGACFALTRI